MSFDSTRSPLAPEPAPDPDRSAKQIEKDIVQRRERLINTVDTITERVKPANMASAAKQKATAQVIDQDNGGVRLNRVLPVVGAAAALVTVMVLRKAMHKPTRTEQMLAKTEAVGDQAAELRDKLAEMFAEVSGAAMAKAAQAWQATEGARNQVSDVASSAADNTRTATQVAREQAAAAAETVSDMASHGNEQASKWWKKIAQRLPVG